MNTDLTLNRRKYKRVRIHNLSRIDEGDCQIVNASRDGLLVSVRNASLRENVELQLKIDGKWVELDGDIMWSVTDPHTQFTSMGVFVTKAPLEYKELIENLYLEADETGEED